MKKMLLTTATLIVAGPSAAAKAHKFASAIEKVIKPQPKRPPLRVASQRANVYIITSVPS